MEIATVWIEDGCICCSHCVGQAPEVFVLSADGSAVVLGAMREDAITSDNARERARLNAVGLEFQEAIAEAADGCPVEIIRFA